jgi:hypothetical protein
MALARAPRAYDVPRTTRRALPGVPKLEDGVDVSNASVHTPEGN